MMSQNQLNNRNPNNTKDIKMNEIQVVIIITSGEKKYEWMYRIHLKSTKIATCALLLVIDTYFFCCFRQMIKNISHEIETEMVCT